MDDLRCQYCSRDFMKRDHLFRHERVHTKEKPFSCPTCHTRFARKDVLKRHERSHARSAARTTRTASVNSDVPSSSLNHRLSDKSTSRHVPEASAMLGLPMGQSTQPEPHSQTCLGAELWDSTQMTNLPAVLDGTLDELSNVSLPSCVAPANEAAFEASLEAWAILSGPLPISTPQFLLSPNSTNDDSAMSFSSLGLWNRIQPTCSDQTTVNGVFEWCSATDETSCEQRKKDRRTRLVEAIHKAWATRWCMSDFKMSVGMYHNKRED